MDRKEETPSRKEAPYVKQEPFFVQLKRAATEHGYGNPFLYPLYLIRYVINYHLYLMALYAPDGRIRVFFYRVRGVKIGKGVGIGINVNIDNSYPELITIADGAAVTGPSVLLAHSRPPEYYRGVIESFVAPVTLERNVWIGVGVIILPGVTIGEGSIVSAGSVVARDVPPHSLVAGNPARRIRELKPDEIRTE